VNTISRQSTSLNGFPYCARVQRNSGATNTGPTYLVQAVESINGYQFQGKTATLSFYARAGANFSSSGSALTVNIETSTGTDQSYIAAWAGGVSIPSSKTLTTSWQLFTVTGVVPATANQVAVAFVYTPTGTAGAADYFEITGVQLEQNIQPTPFEQRPIGTELALCQRYYYLHTPSVGNTQKAIGVGVWYNATQLHVIIKLAQIMRAQPTLIMPNGAGYYVAYQASAAVLISSLSLETGASTTTQVELYAGGLSGGTAGYASMFRTDNVAGSVAFSAEL
jgi:hypothetical protein